MSKKYIVKALTSVVKGYTKLVTFLEKKWADKHASSFRNYTLFKKGVHSTLMDVSDLGQLMTHITLCSRPVVELLPTLNRHQVYVLRQVPKDLMRISPVLILAPLPGTILILPIFFAFPRVFLSRAFWTPEQCESIDTKALAHRFHSGVQSSLLEQLHLATETSLSSAGYSQPVLRSLKEFADVLNQISQSKPITLNQVPAVIPAFKGPLALERLDKSHLTGLCKLHDLSICSYAWTMNSFLWGDTYTRKSILQTYRILVLKKHAHFLYAEDKCMNTEKLCCIDDDNNSPSSEFKQLCLLRGINPYAMNNKDLMEELRLWISMSTIASSGTDVDIKVGGSRKQGKLSLFSSLCEGQQHLA
uniref:Letm1 RBD domain-containing protein n=1 Tax=Trichobilharzia regenti TaxID=157069 RepID=A0AA85JKS3_TRIRE|nr:unnamed protein product [Trichobilharzia regenti]